MFTRLIIYCCCLIPLFSLGQELRIAKDNLLCAYGLKNDQQKWVVPASFVTLEVISDEVYKTFDGQFYGLLNREGKEIIPPTYDKIEPNGWGGYEVTKDDKIGFINRSGELKIAPEYSRYQAVRGGEILLYRSVKDSIYMTYYTTYADTSGKILLPEQKGVVLPFMKRRRNEYDDQEKNIKALAIIGSHFQGFDNVMMNVGAIDEVGNVVIPRIYDRMNYRDEQSYWVWKNGKLGVISRSGTTIIEPKYAAYEIGGYGNALEIRGNADRLFRIIGEDGKSGLMHTSGRIMLEPKYDQIERMYPNMTSDSATYLVYSDTKVGIAGKSGLLTFEVVYDTLIPIAVMEQNLVYGQQPKLMSRYFFFRQNNKYGLMNYSGKVLVQPCYDAFARFYDNYNRQTLYSLSDKSDVLLINLFDDSVVLDEMKPASSFGHIRFFESGGLLYPFKPVGENGVLQLIESYDRTDYLITVREFPRDYKTLLFDPKGKPVGQENIRYIEYVGKRHAIVRCEHSKVGLLDVRSKKWLLDTVYLDVKQSDNGKGTAYFWGQLYPPKGDYISPGWQVFDTLGKLKTKTIFGNVVTGGDTLVVEARGMKGVMNGQLEWIIEPAYKQLLRVGSQHYAVYTKGGHFGLITISGKLVVDTIYSEFDPVYEFEKPYYTTEEFIEKPSQWWLFSNEKQRKLYNNEGDSWSSTGTVTEQQQLNEHLDDFVLRGNRNHATSALKLYMDPKLEGKVRKAKIKQDLISRVRLEYDKTDHCSDFDQLIYNNRIEESPCRGLKNYHYKLVNCGNRFYTLQTSHFISRYSMEMPMESEEISFYYNAVKVGNTSREVRLSDIFGTGNVLQEELLRIIKERDDLDLDCSSPEIMVSRLEGRFSLSDKGVTLYYGTNTIGAIEFLIPTTRLALHAESKWILSYLEEK